MRSPRTCCIDGCERRHDARGWCSTHYARWKLRGDPGADIPLRRFLTEAPQCAVEECPKAVYAKTYCRAHYQRLKRYGDPEGLSDWALGDRDSSEMWRARRMAPGHRSRASNGYMYVFMPENPMANGRGHVMEHRLVMAQHLGRTLTEAESVHHKNGDRVDNRLENLELWAGASAQPSGQRPRDLVEWARRVLEQYADEVDAGLV